MSAVYRTYEEPDNSERAMRARLEWLAEQKGGTDEGEAQ